MTRPIHRISLSATSPIAFTIAVAFIFTLHTMAGDTNEKKFGSVTGSVHTVAGLPAKDATVFLLETGLRSYSLPTKPKRAPAGNDGRYRFDDVVIGTYQVWAELGDETSLMKPLQGTRLELREPNSEKSIDLKLHRGCTYRVSIVDKATKTFIQNARVTLGWTDIEREAKSDRNGIALMMPLGSMERFIVVEADGYATQFQKHPLQEQGTTLDVQFELEKEARIEGKLVSSMGLAFESGGISARRTGFRMEPGLGSTKIQPDGTFVLHGLPRESELELRYSALDHVGGTEKLRIEQEKTIVNWTKDVAAKPRIPSLDVVVVDFAGEPIAEAKVSNQGDHEKEVRLAELTDEGTYRLTELYANNSTVSITVAAPGYVGVSQNIPRRSVVPDHPVVIKMQDSLTWKARVIEPDGTPSFHRLTWAVSRMFSGLPSVESRTDANGYVELTGLSPDDKVLIDLPAKFEPLGEIPIIPDELGEVQEIRLRDAGAIRLAVVDSVTKKPIRKFRGQLKPNEVVARQPGAFNDIRSQLSNPHPEFSAEVSSDTDEFIVRGRPVDRSYELTVSAEGYEKLLFGEVTTASEKSAQRVLIELVPSTALQFVQLSGKVLDYEGLPAKKVKMYWAALSRPPKPQDVHILNQVRIPMDYNGIESEWVQRLETTTDDGGNFRFLKVIQAPYGIVVAVIRNEYPTTYELESEDDFNKLKSPITIRESPQRRVELRIDRDLFSKAKSILIESKWNATIDRSYVSLTRNLNQIGDNFQFELPIGSYKLRLQSKKHKPESEEDENDDLDDLFDTNRHKVYETEIKIDGDSDIFEIP